MAVIPHDRKPGLIAWLRSLGKDQASVRLDWHKRGQLLTHLFQTATILRSRIGSFEWQAIGKLREAKNALRSLGGEGWRRRVAHPETYRNFDHMFYAYILRSGQNPERFYYGFSTDLKKRL